MARVFTYSDLQDFFKEKNYRVVIAGDAETVVHKEEDGKIISETRPGGVSVALEPIAKSSHGTFIARGRTEIDKKVLNNNSKIKVDGEDWYTLKRFFITSEEEDMYYFGFANQTLWPLCHVAFQQPIFRNDWYEGYKQVNKKFAQSIKEDLKGRTFLWINDYQMCLVPKYLEKPKDTMMGMFWHIPWPTWEIFRILPQKIV